MLTIEGLSIERDLLIVSVYHSFTSTNRIHSHQQRINCFSYQTLFAQSHDSFWNTFYFRHILMLVNSIGNLKIEQCQIRFVWLKFFFRFCSSKQWCGWTWANCCLRSNLYWNIQSWWFGLSKRFGSLLSGISDNRSSISY